MRQGVEVSLVPTYTPLRLDEADVSGRRIFFGGINVYLASKWRWWRVVPGWLRRILDRPRLLAMAARRAVNNDAAGLGPLTLDMLAGEVGPMREQVEELAVFLAETLKPDIVIFSNALLAGSVRRIKAHLAVPVLCVLQGDDIFWDSLPSAYREQVLIALRDRVRDFDGFITHTQFYAKQMSEELSVSLDRFHQLPLGIDLTGHDGEPRPANVPFTIGYFARICPEKGLHLAIEAFAKLHESHPQTRLRVAGYLGERDRAYFADIRAQAARLGSSVEFVGTIESHADKSAFLKSLDVFSVPTVYREPKGLSILEAMANGVAVVQPAHGAFPELIRDAIDGLLFPPSNIAALANRWKELLLDDSQRVQLARSGQQRVRENFSADTMARRTLDLITEVAQLQRKQSTVGTTLQSARP